MEAESETNSTSTNGNSGGNTRPQIAQMSLYERQAVQALQALQRQPNAAQYFHHFMLHQQISNAQLHSLAQATLAANRQANSPNTSTAQQTTTTQASVNLTTTSAAQLISRSQSVTTPTSGTLTQSVLLGSNSSPPVNASQAQMYLRPQLGGLLQVNRTLSRAVPLPSQLILMPNCTVAAVQQQEVIPQSPTVHSDSDQAQNLAVRSPQTSTANTQIPNSAQKVPTPTNSQPSGLNQNPATVQTLAVSQAQVSGHSLNLSQGTVMSTTPTGTGQTSTGLNQATSLNQVSSACQVKSSGISQPPSLTGQTATVSQGSQTEAENTIKKAEGENGQTVGMNLTRSATPAPSQTLISSATSYTAQIQPHPLIQQQVHLQQKQVVIQQQIAIHQQQFQHRQSQLLHTAAATTHHLQIAPQSSPQPQPQSSPQPASQTLVVQPMVQTPQTPLPLQSSSETPSQASKTLIPIQPKQPMKIQNVPSTTGAKLTAQPHIPVQVVGARQPGPAQAQALTAQLQALGPTASTPAASSQQQHVNTTPSLTSASPEPQPFALPQGQAISPVPTPESSHSPGATVMQTEQTSLGPPAEPSRNEPPPSTVTPLPAGPYAQAPLLPIKTLITGVKRKLESEDEKVETSEAITSSPPPFVSVSSEMSKPGEEQLGEREKLDASASLPVTRSIPTGIVNVTPTVDLSSRQNSDSKPPQAIVKPQILTHVIEGFVIQEGAEPFPVGCAQQLKDSEKGSVSSENDQTTADGNDEDLKKKEEKLKCEYCGNYKPAYQFRGSKRFCSVTCAKRYNVSCGQQFRLKRKKMEVQEIESNAAKLRWRGPRRSSSEIAWAKIQGKRPRNQEDSSRGSDNSSYDEALSPTSPGATQQIRANHVERDGSSSGCGLPPPDLLGINPVFLSSNPSHWNVDEVYEFIASLPGCQEIAEEFRSQEIDGQALLLLKEEHLMSAMNIKLGPALKICAKINVLKES